MFALTSSYRGPSAYARKGGALGSLPTLFLFLPLLLGVVALTTNAAVPKVVITKAAQQIALDGDCNFPAVWINGQLRVYESPYPQNGYMGGVKSYRTGASVLALNTRVAVNPDRNVLGSYSPAAFGPWFESIVRDGDGTLWAYYHAEFPNSAQTKVHPRIGAQVSRDGGVTWKDLGVILDTPAGTDEYHSWLGYGFSGGNGDFSVLLDPNSQYLYFFFSEYGAPAAAQGVAVARMAWSDRTAPVGKVMKWSAGQWTEPGLGGKATPVFTNLGDVHGIRAPFDFWWGPSIHWNTHLQRYVILLNRSNTADFTFKNGVANWYTTAARLDDPSGWDQPQALPFPENYLGSWYPQVIGLATGETDKIASKTARLFVHGISKWEITFERPEEGNPPPANLAPVLNTAPAPRVANVNTAFSYMPAENMFTDPNGDVLTWSVSGLPSWLTFNAQSHLFSGTVPMTAANQVSTISIVAKDPSGLSAKTSFTLTIAPPPTPTVTPVTLRPVLSISVGGATRDVLVAPGTTLSVVGRATDYDGDMREHWLEVRNPLGVWSWEGWLTTEPWAGELGGSSYSSTKSTSFTFTDEGTYTVRTTAIDVANYWLISAEIHVRVSKTVAP
jgi:Putative Ig domain